MKIKFIYIIIFIFQTQSYYSQNINNTFSNTYWKVISHYVNSDTWTLEPLSKKPSKNVNFSYLEFDNKNHFVVNLNYGCKEIALGEYRVDKSHIYFNTKENNIEPKCKTENENFWPEKMAFKRTKNILYLTQPTEWYDEEIIKKQDTILIPLEHIRGIDNNDEGKEIMLDPNNIPFHDGIYKILDNQNENNTEKSTFKIKDGFLDGKFISISKNEVREINYQNGKQKSEKTWRNGVLKYERSNLEKVERLNKNKYIITLIETSYNAKNQKKDSLVTVFHNTKPFMKARYENNKLITEKDFKKNSFKKFNKNGNLVEIKNSKYFIEYDSDGNEKNKEIYKSGSTEFYKYGILSTKEIYTKRETTKITFDKEGNIINSKVIENENLATIADMDKYEPDLNEEQFNYYKKLK